MYNIKLSSSHHKYVRGNIERTTNMTVRIANNLVLSFKVMYREGKKIFKQAQAT